MATSNAKSQQCPKPAMLVAVIFSRHAEAIRLASEALENEYGPVALKSEAFSFHHTDYYQQTMGADLLKQFFAFDELVAEDCLPDVKLQAITLEKELADQKSFPEIRPVNIDPGLLTLGKFLLASTKDHAHRIYLQKGIYAEVTLKYTAGHFEPWPWTFADYREPGYHKFLLEVRDYYQRQLSKWSRTANN